MLLRSVTSFAVMFAAAGAALAQGDNTVRANAAMEGDKLPFLCRDRDSVGLIIPIVSRAQEARISGDQGKAQSLMEVAARLQSEICVRPSADDVVILRTPRRSYRYRVVSTKVVRPEDVEVLYPASRDRLTLITCYPFDWFGAAPERFIVRAERVAPPRPPAAS